MQIGFRQDNKKNIVFGQEISICKKILATEADKLAIPQVHSPNSQHFLDRYRKAVQNSIKILHKIDTNNFQKEETLSNLELIARRRGDYAKPQSLKRKRAVILLQEVDKNRDYKEINEQEKEYKIVCR